LTTALAEYLGHNNFVQGVSPVYDIYSNRVPDTYKNFRVLRKVKFQTPIDSLASQTTIKHIKFGLSGKQLGHIRWATDGTTITEGDTFMVITCDNGNCSLTTACTATAGVPQATSNTGLFFNMKFTHYYYDN